MAPRPNQMQTKISTMSLLKMLLLIFCCLPYSAFAAQSEPARVLNILLAAEPPELNSTKSADSTSNMVLGHIMEGLVRSGVKDDDFNPGIAEKWEISSMKAVFHLRKNALWADGKPVTAQDFVFAWRLVVDPKVASEYAFIMFAVKNAEAINSKKLPTTDLGVKAIDDHTLSVEFEKPCPYFLGLVTTSSYLPIREDFYNQFNEKFGADASKLLSDGPYILKSWVHGASLSFAKNPKYWNADAIKLDEIRIPFITPDSTSTFSFFKDRKIDMIERLGSDDLPRAVKEKLAIRTFADGSNWYLTMNFRKGRPTANLNLRKALLIVVNLNKRQYLSRIVAIPQSIDSHSIVPTWMKGEKEKFVKEHPYVYEKGTLEDAKKYLELARQELGGKIPPLSYLTDDTNFSMRAGQYFQSIFKIYLGLDIRIDSQIFKQRLAKSHAGQFDLLNESWGPDYNDPMTFTDLRASWNENNRGLYTNPEFDRVVRAAQAESDPHKRMKFISDAEKIALDDITLIPLYERSVAYVVNSEKVSGIVRHAMGADPDYYNASLKSGGKSDTATSKAGQ